MLLTDLIASLRVDLSDPDKDLFPDAVLQRCIERGFALLERDYAVFAVSGGVVLPEPQRSVSELMLILGRIYACQYMQSQTANGFQFSSADKSIDKRTQSANWAKMEESLWLEYQKQLKQLVAGQRTDQDWYVTPPPISPRMYDAGINRGNRDYLQDVGYQR